jgi:nucleoporin GLE1
MNSRNPSRLKRTPQEQREIDETMLSFRRRGEYEDPFKKWTKDTRTAAFVSNCRSVHHAMLSRYP